MIIDDLLRTCMPKSMLDRSMNGPQQTACHHASFCFTLIAFKDFILIDLHDTSTNISIDIFVLIIVSTHCLVTYKNMLLLSIFSTKVPDQINCYQSALKKVFIDIYRIIVKSKESWNGLTRICIYNLPPPQYFLAHRNDFEIH